MTVTVPALALLLAVSSVPGGPAAPVVPDTAEKPAPPAARITVEIAWEAELPAAPLRAPRSVSGAGEQAIAVFALDGTIQARHVDDGSLAWSSEGLSGAGLSESVVPTADGPVLGWAGVAGSRGPVLRILSAIDGRVLSETALDTPPEGPPLPVSTDGGGPVWYVQVAGGRVLIVSATGRVTGWFEPPGPVRTPLVEWDGRVLAIAGEDRRFVAVGSAARGSKSTDVDPRTIATLGPRVFGAGERSFEAWRCRERSRGGSVRCRQDWRQPVGGAITAPPIVRDGSVIVGSWDTHLYAFAPRSGHLLWRTHAGPRLTTSPAAWDDELFAVVPTGGAVVDFYRYADGAREGRVEGDPLEIFITAPARAGDLLLVTVLLSPSQTAAVRAYRVHVAPREEEQPGAGN